MVWIFRIIGGVAIVAVSFFATLYAIEYFAAKDRDAQRVQELTRLRSAIEAYYKAHNAYPVLDDKPASELKAALVDGGFIKTMPDDHLALPNKQYRYTSDGKNYFGLWVWLEGSGACVTGVAAKKSGLWGKQAECPF